jgi:hypothetical protein
MKSWLLVGAGAAIVVAQGCGSGFSAATAMSGAGGSGTSVSTSASSSSGTTSTGGTGGATSSSASGTGGATGCPNIVGAYSVTEDGAGCTGLDIAASECIKPGNATCEVQLVSRATTGNRGVDGTVTLDVNGDFTNGAVSFGTTARTGCTGTWQPGSPPRLVVDCGGTGTAQSCTATLIRLPSACTF